MYDELKNVIEESSNIVFLAGQAFPQKAESRISEVWTDFTIRNISFRRKQYSATAFL